MILRIDRLTNATPARKPRARTAAALGLGLALLGPVGAASANDFAFTMTQPLFPSSSFDDLQIGEAGDLTSLPLPSGLEFPWDVDVVGDRLFVVGAGQDDGTTPPSRQFNTDNRGEIWSMDFDGSDAVQHASGLDFPQFLDVSPDGSTVYFGQAGEGFGSSFADNGLISRLDTATNTVVDIVTAPSDAGPTGVHYDPASDSIFYQVNNRGEDVTMQQIRRVDASVTGGAAGSDDLWLENPTPPDGTLDSNIEFTVVSAGRNVQVHDGFVYWTYRNGEFTPSSEIRRLPLSFDIDTDDPESFETIATGVRIIDFQIVGDVLTWTDPEQNRVSRSNLDGSGLTVLATGDDPGASLPIGVGVVPEPASATLLALLGGGLLTRRGRRRARD